MKVLNQRAKPAVVAVRTQRRVSARNPAGTDRTTSKSSPGQLGHAYNRLVRRDRKTGALSLRMRISRHPYFVQLREQAGRKRDFRPERENLLDAIVPLMVSTVESATHRDSIDIGKLAGQLSENGREGSGIRKL